MYYQLQPDVFATHGITGEPALPSGVTFLGGAPVTARLATPLVFPSNFPRDEPPRAMAGLSIPVWSAELVRVLRGAGIDNLQVFAATIQGRDGGVEWQDYLAVNVIGRVAAADMAKSKYTEIMSTPGGGAVVGFTELHIDASKARPFDLFRLAEDPTVMVCSQRVVDALKQNPQPRGWGISAIELGDEAG